MAMHMTQAAEEAIMAAQKQQAQNPPLEKSAAVLDYAYTMGDFVTFEYPDMEESKPGLTTTIPFELWADMGQPQEVTVTIEPGNALQKKYAKDAQIEGLVDGAWLPATQKPKAGDVMKWQTKATGSMVYEGTVTAVLGDESEATLKLDKHPNETLYWTKFNKGNWYVKAQVKTVWELLESPPVKGDVVKWDYVGSTKHAQELTVVNVKHLDKEYGVEFTVQEDTDTYSYNKFNKTKWWKKVQG